MNGIIENSLIWYPENEKGKKQLTFVAWTGVSFDRDAADVIFISISKCNKKDVFSKKMGLVRAYQMRPDQVSKLITNTYEFNQFRLFVERIRNYYMNPNHLYRFKTFSMDSICMMKELDKKFNKMKEEKNVSSN
jgi:hypothetical protein